MGFGPIATPAARVLVLGSLPGRASLAAGAYYAQPRNSFWRIIGDTIGADPGLPYAERLARLGDAGIALWDVLASAHRPGSLDADIDPATLVPNPIGALLARHPGIGRICFNGQAAARFYERLVLPALAAPARDLARVVLPSTSPAHASVPYAHKLLAWRRALGVDGTTAVPRRPRPRRAGR